MMKKIEVQKFDTFGDMRFQLHFGQFLAIKQVLLSLKTLYTFNFLSENGPLFGLDYSQHFF